jgi:hypothetical protein
MFRRNSFIFRISQYINKQAERALSGKPCSDTGLQRNPRVTNRREEISRGVCCLLGLHFAPEDGGSTFLRIVGRLLPDYTASHPRIVTALRNLNPDALLHLYIQ